MESVQVWRGKHGDPVPLFGPLPGLRDGHVIAYEFELPDSYQPWPGRTLLERSYVLLELGVSLCNPTWRESAGPDGERIDGVGSLHGDPDAWYVDLVHVSAHEGGLAVRDQYVDVIVPGDGRHYRMLDLDEFADAIEDGALAASEAVDALRRWQRFLDRHLHSEREATNTWTDFPPAAIAPLMAVPQPLGEVVRVAG